MEYIDVAKGHESNNIASKNIVLAIQIIMHKLSAWLHSLKANKILARCHNLEGCKQRKGLDVDNTIQYNTIQYNTIQNNTK